MVSSPTARVFASGTVGLCLEITVSQHIITIVIDNKLRFRNVIHFGLCTQGKVNHCTV